MDWTWDDIAKRANVAKCLIQLKFLKKREDITAVGENRAIQGKNIAFKGTPENKFDFKAF